MLYNEDCFEFFKRIEDGSVDLVLADPPYGTTRCKWDTPIPFEPLWRELNRILKPNGVVCLFGCEPFSSALRMSNIKAFKYDWYWHKTTATNFLNARRQPLRNVETVSVFYRKQPYFNPQKTQGHKRKVSLAKHKLNSKKSEAYGDYRAASYDSTERFPTQVLRKSRLLCWSISSEHIQERARRFSIFVRAAEARVWLALTPAGCFSAVSRTKTSF